MSLATIISIVLLVLGMSDWMTTRTPRLQRDIFHIAFLLTYVLCTIKYYYGADICQYVPFYENIPSCSYILAHPDDLSFNFETGFGMFCSVLKHAGVSFYWMTAIVSTIYFIALYLLLRLIPRQRTFALMILFVLDSDLILTQLRQCLAVSCFIFMVLAIRDKRYVLTLLFAFLTSWFHKSGVFIVGLTLFFVVLHIRRLPLYVYQLLIVVLALLIVVPLYKIVTPILTSLPFPEEYVNSILLHFRKGRQVQMIFFVYMAAVVCIAHFTQYKKTRLSTIGILAVIGIVFAVSLYQYYFILHRIRSYFLPFVIVYIFRLVADTDALKIPYATLLKQTAAVVVYVMMIHATWRLLPANQHLISNASNTCTVIELLHADKHAVQSRQMQLAEGFWKYDWMKHDTHNQIN